MTEEEIKELLKRFRQGTCTDEERELLELWFEKTSSQSKWNWESDRAREQMRARMRAGIQTALKEERVVTRKLWPWLSAAASVALLLVGGWFYWSKENRSSASEAHYHTAAVAPGSNQAMLTLADGSTILVDAAATGVLSTQGSSQVTKTGEGRLEYKDAGTASAPSGRNTLSVPKGATFKVTLPDGTAVWLNSATQLIYPASNSVSERIVELHGEAYFEVSPDKNRPFKVVSGDTEVRVTGTHFNVAAYEDEPQVYTTLAEGQVIISNKGSKETLRPGQQAITEPSGLLQIREVDVESWLAWKEGYFVFDDQDLRSVMKMAARWYDVEVTYEGHVPNKRFGGTFSKSKDLKGLLTYLEQLGGIHFKQQGKTITVMN
ncbi:FecR family protein [Larkinella arboricola]|uniref:FecR family protein n=1 Tax=Larkinella arboricola TaxID=643671 RepID=A0A327WNN2_LARAB|nr:FecR domain-containing protein [Larkinella arboricola]RAJ93205.1 FecR family protein [Larkinella arboricola]